MNVERFIAGRQEDWNRLAQAVHAVGQRGPRGLDPAQLEQMLHLYRDASADLARLRAAGADDAATRGLNRLVVRAHGQIYRARRSRLIRPLWHFLSNTHPRLFRRYWRFSFASLALSTLFFVLAFQAVQSRPDLVADVMGGMDQEFRGDKTGSDISDRFQSAPSPILSSLVTTNNIGVALTAFALGITGGVGTAVVLVRNGAMLGGIAGAFHRSNAGADLWMTILPHGALELSAIVVAGGAGLLMGFALLCPGRRTRSQALRQDALAAMQLVLGLVPAFILAGLFEGFVTPSLLLPPWLKVTLGVAAGAAFWLHLLLSGRHGAGAGAA